MDAGTRDLFYKLLNLETHPEVLADAHKFIDERLAHARTLQMSPNATEIWRPFRFTEQSFQENMDAFYIKLVADADHYNPDDDPVFKDREDVIERIRQYTAFNMTDGVWLYGILKAGPIDAVRGLLISILVDEIGGGVLSQNHSNVYRDLLQSVDITPPRVDAKEFAYDKDMVNEAYEPVVLELAIAQFSETYFPEVLGMTLWLEWSVVEAKKVIALFRRFGVDPHYYSMHLGIDNPDSGHANQVMRAIKIYLDNLQNTSGVAEVKEQWMRIWNGYVAFGNSLEALDDAILEKVNARRLSLGQQMIALVERKERYGRLSHARKQIGFHLVDELFNNPKRFLSQLIQARYVIPGNADKSPLFNLFGFEQGPMYRVFSDEELQLWREWILEGCPLD